jgi:type I restriction enzyme R subunit
MNPEVKGQDLRLAFDRPEYRVMLVADKFQTGFDQPKLVAMYVDKKIANDVEIVQTFSRLNRMAPGKDEVFIIDFVNDPENVRRAFAMYDNGAQIEDAQDPNVIYEIQEQLDGQGLYDATDLEAFKEARFKTIRDITHAQEPQHKALYTATDGPKRLFEQRLKMLREAIATWEAAFDKAHSQGDQAGMKSADHHRQEHAEQIKTLMSFKAGLGRFCRTYAYVAQLIDFAILNWKTSLPSPSCCKSVWPAKRPSVDLKGLVLTGFDIKGKEDAHREDDKTPVLKPIGPGGGGGAGDTPHFLTEIIDKLNHLFGEATRFGSSSLRESDCFNRS